MRDYELVFVLDPDLNSQKRKSQVAKIKKIITDLKGKVISSNEWGKKEFAYPIKRRRFGDYFFWEVKLPPEAPTQIDRKFRLEEELLRFLLVRSEKTLPKKLAKKSAGKKKPSRGGEKS